ncbi:hypothetical protein S245_037025, partial [Arachis hypogaea]
EDDETKLTTSPMPLFLVFCSDLCIYKWVDVCVKTLHGSIYLFVLMFVILFIQTAVYLNSTSNAVEEAEE